MRVYKTLKERFWEKINKLGENDCWEWIACKSKDGYGKIRVDGKTLVAHRLSWEFIHGIIPKGLCICHICDNPGCVNPNHLFIGTNEDNQNDKIKKGRAIGLKGEKNYFSKLTESKVRDIRQLGISGLSQRKIAKIYDVSQADIFYILSNQIWKHIL